MTIELTLTPSRYCEAAGYVFAPTIKSLTAESLIDTIFQETPKHTGSSFDFAAVTLPDKDTQSLETKSSLETIIEKGQPKAAKEDCAAPWPISLLPKECTNPPKTVPSMSESYWLATLQHVQLETIQKRKRVQENNRVAAIKSRNRKKQEWNRLLASEKNLQEENEELKNKIIKLQELLQKYLQQGSLCSVGF